MEVLSEHGYQGRLDGYLLNGRHGMWPPYDAPNTHDHLAAGPAIIFSTVSSSSTMKSLIVFDLDGTLAPSKSAIDAEMGTLLTRLIGVVKVAIISGGAMSQFQQQLVANLPADGDLTQLVLLPTCGTQFYQYDGTWKQRYAENLSSEQKTKIIAALKAAIARTGFAPQQTWGEPIEDRESQITYSALGQQAPLDEKAHWDPDSSKRKQIKALLDVSLPEFSVRTGGSTSIDITLPGIDKAYGIRKLRDILAIPISAMLYIGDALFPGGNDEPARTTGADCIQVRDPEETKRVIEAILACLDP
jgi:HAD superfamily hydrolase (TIGR01484 family)